MRRSLYFDDALLPSGWAKHVRVDIEDRAIAAVATCAPAGGAERIAGIAIPGLPNLHCHAFQRGMAELAERRGPAHDSFWTWREVMYRFLDRLTPDDAQAIAAFAYIEMLERGFTAVGEFHYLHHDRDGAPYADIGEMAQRIAAAAQVAGIGLTLLPCFYAYGGFGGAAPVHGQIRFLNEPDRFARLFERSRQIAAAVPGGQIGIAPHSLRAVTPATLREVVSACPDGPIHIHVAEQQREVEDCVAWSGARPVSWLVDNMPVDARWCAIHATHMLPDEAERLARTGAVAGLCPLTESSLGDGIFDGPRWLAAGGRYGVGTNSNIDIDPAGELRQFEYAQRLAQRARNVMTAVEGQSTARMLFELGTCRRRAGARPADGLARARPRCRHRRARRGPSRSCRAQGRPMARRLDLRRRPRGGEGRDRWRGARGDVWPPSRARPIGRRLSRRHRASLELKGAGMSTQLPRYAEIRRALEKSILSGAWPPGHRVPSEQKLVERYRCSRMTVNRAMNELAASGLIVRRRRAGTFVAVPLSQKSVLTIQNIPEDIAQEGQSYRFELRSRRLRQASTSDAERLRIKPRTTILALTCLHFADGVPLVAEDRLINLAIAPAARDTDFSDVAPGTWLLTNVQWREAEHLIRATNANAKLARLLQISAGDACLVVDRVTWLGTGAVTHVQLTYPGRRHRLAVRFNPSRERE